MAIFDIIVVVSVIMCKNNSSFVFFLIPEFAINISKMSSSIIKSGKTLMGYNIYKIYDYTILLLLS